MELNKNDSSSLQPPEAGDASNRGSQVSASKSKSDKSGSSGKAFKVLVVVLLVALVGMGAFAAIRLTSSSNNKIGYASEAVVLTSEEEARKAMEEAMEQMGNGPVALSYQNDAFSEDGIHFECYIVNSEANARDMFITIFADQDFKNQLYLSGLLPPGRGFRQLTLDHALPEGNNLVYVAITQVAEENGEQVIKNQVFHTMNFHVER